MNEPVTFRESVESAYAGPSGKRPGERYTLVTQGGADGKIAAKLLSSDELHDINKDDMVMWLILDAQAYDTSPPAVEGVPLAPGAIVLHPYLVTFSTDVTKHVSALAADIDRAMKTTDTPSHTTIIQSSLSGRPILISSPVKSGAESMWAFAVFVGFLTVISLSLVYWHRRGKKQQRAEIL
jgi:hypothetical protein